MSDESSKSSANGSEKLHFRGSSYSPEHVKTENTKEESSSVCHKNTPVSAHAVTQRYGDSLPCSNLLDTPKRRTCKISDNGVRMQDIIPLSPILAVTSPEKDLLGVAQGSGKENFDNTWQYDEGESCSGDLVKSTIPTSVHSQVTYLVTGNDNIRHQLLVQRTFHTHEDTPELMVTTHPKHGALSVKTSSPKYDNKETRHSPGQPRAQLSPFLTPYNDNASDFHSVFQTPVRGRQYRHDHGLESTPSFTQHSQTPSQHQHPVTVTPVRYQHSMTPRRLQGARTPSSAGSPYLFTPGRNFYNPFEIDSGQLHLPIMSPSVFQIGNAETEEADDKEHFWSVEQAALLMPVDIKESDVLKQHFHQQKKDKEKDPAVQSAINKFFSNEYILPSPWSDKVKLNLPRTSGSLKTVSSQTTMSVPPDVDLFAELGGKFFLPEHRTGPEVSADTMGNSFIRRKLLHQLNENDSPMGGLGGSPVLPPSKPVEILNSDTSSPTKHTTPEWDKQTPRKTGSGHFSSSPIRGEDTSYKEHWPMSESDLLASPELSPIAGKGRKSFRSSDIFCSHQGLENPREIMQLDFSSILDEPDEFENASDKTGTLINSNIAPLQQQSDESVRTLQEQNPLLSSSSHVNEDGSAGSSKLMFMMGKTFTNSGLSAESTGEITGSMPQSISSQDTGYQTASMQSTVNQEFASQETLPLSGFASNNSLDPTRTLTLTEKDLVTHTSLTNQFTGMPFKSDLGNNLEDNWFSTITGSHLEKSDSLSQSEPVLQRQEICRIRKVKTLSDMRRSKEKRSASRNLTQSFNEEDKPSSLNGSNDSRLNESLSSSLFEPRERAEIKLLKAQANSEPFVSQRPVGILREKVIDCVIKETLSQNSENGDVGNCLSLATSSPTDKRSFDDISSTGEAAMRVSENKCLKLVDHGNNIFRLDNTPVLSLGNESTLAEARKLLGKSEALRMEHENSRELESDTFYQLMSEGGQHHGDDKCVSDTLLPEQGSRSSSQSSFLMASVKKKINNVEGAKLGSEIAAEILKRAGEDLAQLKDLK